MHRRHAVLRGAVAELLLSVLFVRRGGRSRCRSFDSDLTLGLNATLHKSRAGSGSESLLGERLSLSRPTQALSPAVLTFVRTKQQEGVSLSETQSRRSTVRPLPTFLCCRRI
jgi:hypothetical protein